MTEFATFSQSRRPRGVRGRGRERPLFMSSQDALERLSNIWAGLPDCSLIVFRHIQKTGGSSVVRVFEDVLQRDLQWSVSGYWTPCWRGRASYLAQGRLRWLRGLRALAEEAHMSNQTFTRMDWSHRSKRMLDTPPWHLRQLFHVHHPDAVECGGMPALQRELGRLRPVAHALPCRVVVAMLVRDPWSFFVSWWYYVGARRCGHCRFREFLRLNPNAQAHMAIGGAARKYSEPLRRRHLERDPALKSAMRSMLRGVDLLGPTERVSRSRKQPHARTHAERADPHSPSSRLRAHS